MTIQYSTHKNYPMPDDGCKNWGAIINGIHEDQDLNFWQLESMLCTRAGESLFGRSDGSVVKRMNPIQ